MKIFKILFFLFLATSTYAKPLTIDEQTEFYDLLPHSKIYIDKSKSLSLQNIQNKLDSFKVNNKKLLSYGYSPNFNVWIKFTLKNKTDKTIERILEYGNSITTEIEFYDINEQVYNDKDGLFSIDKTRKTINPTFKIKIIAN